jgi:serine/threonine protein kinase
LAYIRDQNMTHFDVKEANLFMMSDGTVKVADFGESGISDNTDGTVPVSRKQGVTPGYAPQDLVDAVGGKGSDPLSGSTKSDAFAAGRMAQNLHSGSIVKQKWSKPIMPEDLTGAFGRFSDALTSEKPQDRVTFEAALDSSYIQNVNNYDQAAIQELMKTIVAYGKVIDTGAIEDLKSQIDNVQEQIKAAELQLKDQSLADDKRRQTEQKWKDLRTQLEKLQQELRKVGDKPEAKALAEEIKMLSQQLLRPSGKDSVPTEEDNKDFLTQLGKSASNVKEFSRLLQLPANNRFFKAAGLAQHEAIAAFRVVDDLDTSVNNPHAAEDVERVPATFNAYLKKVKNRDFARILRRAADAAITFLERMYDHAADERGGATIADFKKAKQQVLDTIANGQAFLQHEKQKMDQRLAVAQKQTDDAQGIARQTLELIARGFPPRPEGPAREFQEFKDKVAEVKSDCERTLQAVRQHFIQNMPSLDVLKQYQLEKPAKDAALLLDQMAADIDRKCFSYDQWIDQAAESAADALAGKLDQIAAYEKILLVDVKKLTRDDWAPVGGADSSISTSVERISELMNEIKVFVDLPG